MEWLDRSPIGGENYWDWNNIKSDHDNKILSDEAYKVLDGLHKRGRSLVEAPSAGDISFLKKIYGTLL